MLDFRPGSPEYEALKPASKFEECSKWLALAEAGDLRVGKDPYERESLKSKYAAEQLYWRTYLTLRDPLFDIRHHYVIKPTQGPLILMDPNLVQQEFVSLYMTHREQRVPLKLKVPKSRKQGISTITAGMFFWESSRFVNSDTVVMAQDDEACTYIFSIYRRFHDHDHPDLKAKTERSNRTELLFDHASSIVIRPAGGREGSKGRGATPRFVHTTESTSYPSQQVQIETYNALQESIPRGDGIFTCWVDESTGRGRQGPFYEGCLKCIEDPGGTDWKLFFIPWTRRYDTLPPYVTLTDAEHAEILSTLSDEEKALMGEPFNAKPEQIKWWRQMYKSINANDEAEKRRFAKQEHPLVLSDVFLEKGGDVFDPDVLRLLQAKAEAKDAVNQPWVGYIESDEAEFDYTSHKFTFKTPQPKRRISPSGPLTVWQMPLPQHAYCIGVDLALGKIAGDYTVACVFDRTARKFVARWRARMDSQSALHPVRLLSKFYNDAILNIEINSDPSFVGNLIDTDRRRFLCRTRNSSRTNMRDTLESEYGFRTHSKSKTILIAAHRRTLAYEPQAYTDPVMLMEMGLFQERETSQNQVVFEGAGKGRHDDVAIAGALALVADEDSFMMVGEPGAAPVVDKPVTLAQRLKKQPKDYGEIETW